MMKNPKTSIIVPVYNGIEYIDQLLACFLAQTVKGFEILFIDDGSTDGTGERIQSICKQKLPIDITYSWQENAGVSAARNKGLCQANGDYVCFVDVDDWIPNDYLESLLNAIRNTRANVAMGYVERTKNNFSEKNQTSTVLLPKIEFLRKFLYESNKFSVCAGIYSRQCLEKYRLMFPEGYKYSEDVFLLWQLFSLEDSIALIPKCIYYYVDNPSSAMRRKLDITRLQAIELMRKLESVISSNAPAFSEEFSKFVVARHHWSILWQAARGHHTYSEFLQYTKNFNMKTELRKLYFYPSKHVSWSSRLFVGSPWLYYRLFRIYNWTKP